MPLQSELALDQLRVYQGRNPKPPDFEEFWDRGLAEMRQLSPKVELIPSEFQVPFAKCFHLYFNGMGGARIHAQLLHPVVRESPRPALILFHGYSNHAGDWSLKLGYAAMGYTVAALDCRGQAGLSEDRGSTGGWTLRGHIVRGLEDAPEKLLFRNIFLDAAQLVSIVMSLPGVDPERIGVTGESQGGGLSLACAALEPRIKLVAPIFPFLCDYQRVWEMDLAKNSYAEIEEFFRKRDPLHKKEGEIFTKLGYIDVQHLCPRIRGRVLMGVALADSICPPSTQFAAFNKICSSKELRIYPDFGHEKLPGHADAIFEFMSHL